VNVAASRTEHAGEPGFTLAHSECVTVSAICNRVARRVHLLDREGLQQDFAIVQSVCPLDLERLLAAPDDIFIDELMTILESTDRTTRALKGSFHSRFTLDRSLASVS